MRRYRLRVAAVMLLDSRWSSPGAVPSRKDVIESFRRRGFLPVDLIKHFRQAGQPALPRTLELAILFAAELHPTLAAQINLRLPLEVGWFLEEMHRERIRFVIRSVPEFTVPSVLLKQISRVVLWVAEEGMRNEIVSQGSVRNLFKSKGLIPPMLVNRFKSLQGVEDSAAETLAICFACCVYPERAFQMDVEEELPARMNAFMEILASLCEADSTAESFEAASLRALRGVSQHVNQLTHSECRLLLADLSAAELVPQGIGKSVLADERIGGAALFVATCGQNRFERLLNNWREEGGFIRALRGQICTSPLALASDSCRHQLRPEWAEVRDIAEEKLVEVDGTHLDGAMILTRMVWNKASTLGVPSPADKVEDFWDKQMLKLGSGFPYYAFFSRFAYWWKQCLHTHPFWTNEVLGIDLEKMEAETAAEQPDLPEQWSPHLLRSMAEGYRLVRTTFFRRADQTSGVSPEPKETGSSANEELRRALDSIWYERLQRPTCDEGETEMIKSIASRFPGIGLSAINNLSHKLPRRMRAYYLARFERVSNDDIVGMRIEQKPGSWYEPFRDETGFLPIASLVRGVPLERSIFWAFVTHVILYPRVVPQRPDPWDTSHFLREYWYWIRDDCSPFLPAEEHMRSLSFKAILKSLESNPMLRDLLQKVASCETFDAVDACVSAIPSTTVNSVLQDHFNRFPGRHAVALFQPQNVTKLRKLSSKAMHWIVPVWYYTFVEQFDFSRIVDQLVVDDREVPLVRALHHHMRGTESFS